MNWGLLSVQGKEGYLMAVERFAACWSMGAAEYAAGRSGCAESTLKKSSPPEHRSTLQTGMVHSKRNDFSQQEYLLGNEPWLGWERQEFGL